MATAGGEALETFDVWGGDAVAFGVVVFIWKDRLFRIKMWQYVA